MSAHTPGPWHTFSAQNWGHRWPTFVVSADGDNVAVVCSRRDDHQEQPNAALLAAAPDLLAACEDVCDFLRAHGYDTCLVDAAIRKARGEASP